MKYPEPALNPSSILVLHVDDEQIQLEYVKRFLEMMDESIHVESVVSPEEALRRLESETYDCIVSDYQMPDLDGIELARRIRETSDIPFIIYTGRGSEEAAEAAFTVGIDDYIRKELPPSHYQVLAKRIRTAVEKKRAEDKVTRERDKAQSYLDVAGVMIVVLDTEGRISLLNKRGHEILGVSQEEALGENWFDSFLPSVNAADVKGVFRELMAGNLEPLEFYENPVVTSSGEERIIAWQNSLLHDDDGNIIGTISSGTDITERKRMEEELREKDYIIHSASSVIATCSLDGTMTYVNPAFLETWGFDNPDEVIGRPFPEFWMVSDKMDEIMAALMGEEKKWSGEIQAKKKDGSFFDVYVSAATVLDDKGNPIALTSTSVDITERKRMEEEIQRSEARLRLFMDTATDFFYLYDSNLNLQDVNKSGMIVFPNATSKEDVLGKNMLEIIPGIEETVRPERYREALETGNPVSFDSVKLHPSVGDIEIAIKAFKVGDGLGIHSFNLTEQRVTEKRFETLHSHAAELASATTLAEVAEKTFEAIGKTLEIEIGSFHMVEGDMVKPIYSQDIRLLDLLTIRVDGPGIVARTVRESTTQLVPDTRSDPDYITRPEAMEIELLSELAVPVVLGDEVVAVINLESAELEAFDSNDQRLVEILAEHVASAIERIQSQRRLHELHERHNLELVAGVQRISSMVRHDIRGPLQTILNAAYIANREPEKREEMMGIIKGSVKHANDIMEDWKNQVIEETLDITEVNLSQLISDSLAASLIPSSVTVEVNVESMKVSLDNVKMRRVIDNLIRNALEAMEDVGRLTISAWEDEHEIIIEVSDTGIGILETELGKLFRPFYTTKPTGMGLGLTYSRRAVEAHEGTIDVESKAGEGAKFTISLPKKPEKD